MRNPFGIDLKIDMKKEGGQIVRDYLLILLGTLITAFSFTAFFLPHDLAPGGVTGIATILANYVPLGVGFLSFIINVPLFVMGWRSVGWRFALRSFVAMMLLSLFIDVLPSPDLTGDALSATYILPDPLDKRVARAVADAVMQAARETGVARA